MPSREVSLQCRRLPSHSSTPDTHPHQSVHRPSMHVMRSEAKAPIGRTWEDSPSFVIEECRQLTAVAGPSSILYAFSTCSFTGLENGGCRACSFMHGRMSVQGVGSLACVWGPSV